MSSRRRRLPALIDDLLEEIFVWIACPFDLTRASATCVVFRRLITDPTFLRRYRSRHPPLLLGFFSYLASEGFHPAEAPHPNAPAARALANISAVDYLPPNKTSHWFKTNHWYISDVLDGRLLVQCHDPLPADLREQGDETSFRVIAVVYFEKNVVVLLFFDSSSVSWTVDKSASCDALNSSNEQDLHVRMIPLPYYAYGSIYWHVDLMNKLLKLDITSMVFSIIDLPFGHDVRRVLVVEAGEGRLGMFNCTADCKFLNYHCYNGTQKEDQINEWQMKNVISLPVLDDPMIFGASRRYIFLEGNSKVQDSVHKPIYSLDISTSKIERVNHLSCRNFTGSPYFGFPPWMSPRRI